MLWLYGMYRGVPTKMKIKITKFLFPPSRFSKKKKKRWHVKDYLWAKWKKKLDCKEKQVFTKRMDLYSYRSQFILQKPVTHLILVHSNDWCMLNPICECHTYRPMSSHKRNQSTWLIKLNRFALFVKNKSVELELLKCVVKFWWKSRPTVELNT